MRFDRNLALYGIRFLFGGIISHHLDSSSPFHTLLNFLNDFCGCNEIQNTEGCHLVAHIFKTRPEVIYSVVNEQKAIVNCAHRLQFQPRILFVMQCGSLLEFLCDARRVDFGRYALHTHRRKFQHLDSGKWVNEHDRTLCRLH